MSGFLATAHGLANRLAQAATAAEDGPTWSGADVAGTEADWRIVDVDVGDEVYSGRAGVAWFLGLAAATGPADADRLRKVALGASRAALRATPRSGDGLLVGATGRSLVALDLGRRLDDADLVAEAKDAALAIASHPRDDGSEADFLAGHAGTLLGLLTLHREAGVDVLAACCRLGERLLDGAERSAWGWSWASAADPAETPLCGLAHGAAGYGLALLHLGLITGDERFTEAAREAARYERSWFSEVDSNWPDLRRSALRPNDLPLSYPVFWCHGAGGIGLARLHAGWVTGDGSAWADATAAVNAGRRAVTDARRAHHAGQPVDQSLCHGLGGVIELFLTAADITGAPEHRKAARRTGELSLAMTVAQGGAWGGGLPDRRETPGLFLGLAGIGVTALRLHDPSLAPSPALFGVPPLP